MKRLLLTVITGALGASPVRADVAPPPPPPPVAAPVTAGAAAAVALVLAGVWLLRPRRAAEPRG